jgi:hypothetical protein
MISALFLKYGFLIIGFFTTIITIAFGFNQRDKRKAVEAKTEVLQTVAKEQIKQAQKEADISIETIKGANDAKTETSKLSSDSVVNELRDKWTRD